MERNSVKLTEADGTPVVWVGVNYWSRAGGPRMWLHYDAAIVGEELRMMRDHDIGLTRSFFFWPDFMPAENTLEPLLLERFDDFLDRHLELGMTTIPTFVVGHMSAQNWDPAWRHGRDVFGDPSFVEQQRWFVEQLVARWKDHPAVAGWLLSNEIPIYADWRHRGVGTLNHAAVTAWARTLITAIREAGGHQPVSVGDGAWGVEVTGADNGFRVRDLAPLIDFHGPHVYRMEDDLLRSHLGAAFVCELLDIGGKPIVLEEFGVTSDYVSEENAAHYYRQVLHSTLLAGATGWIPWNNTDFDDLADHEPYRHHPFEMHFGLTDHRGRPKAQLREVQAFTDVLTRIDFPRLRRPDTDIALVVSSFLEAPYAFTQPTDSTSVVAHTRQAYIAAREADLPVGLAREADGLPEDCRLYLLPSTKQLLAPTWRRLRELAERGATVYASYFTGEHGNQRGAWWPNPDELFGVRKQLHYGLVEPIEDEEVRFVFRKAFGGIPEGVQLRFTAAGTTNSRAYLPVEPDGAEVIAVDGHGRPALLRHRTGPGAMVLCTYPLEHMAAVTARVNPENTWRIYAALAAEAGVVTPVTVDDPRVQCGVMEHVDGRRFVWFISQHADGRAVSPQVSSGTLISLEGDVLSTVELSPYGVAVTELKL